MTVDIVVPALGESITEATILRWVKSAGDAVERDEIVVEIETDKATMELVAPESGVLSEIVKGEGEKVEIGEVIGRVTPGAATIRNAAQTVSASSPSVSPPRLVSSPAAVEAPAPLSPAVRRLVEEHALRPVEIAATGRGGRLTKGDVVQYLEAKEGAAQAVARPQPTPPTPGRPVPPPPQPVGRGRTAVAVPRERIEPLSQIGRASCRERV